MIQREAIKVRRLAAGSYSVVNLSNEYGKIDSALDGLFEIIRTEWDGPQGGRRYLWEMTEPDTWGYCVIGGRGPSPGRRLRDVLFEFRRWVTPEAIAKAAATRAEYEARRRA